MYKQVYLVNNDLKMGKGKIAGQVAHGCCFYMETIMDILTVCCFDEIEQKTISNYRKWMKDKLMAKIVLKVSEKEMIELSEKMNNEGIWNHVVIDCGFTQIPEKSRTCCCVEPVDEDIEERLFGHLKLL